MKRRSLNAVGGILLVMAACGLWVLSGDFQHLFERGWIDAHVRGAGLAGYGLFVAAGSLATACGFSRQAVGILGGYAFGAWLGFGLSLMATLAGCVLAFFFARLFGRALVHRLLPGKLQCFDRLVQSHPFSMTLTIRLLPVGSNLATNLLAGVSTIPKAAFFAASLLGYLPQAVVFSLAGGGLTIGSRLQIALSLALLVLCAIVGARLYRDFRARADLFDFAEKGDA